MSNSASTSESVAAAAPSAPAMDPRLLKSALPHPDAHGPAALLGEHGSVHRKLVENRMLNQTKRKAHEHAKDMSTKVCAPFIGDFIRCEQGRLLSTVVACRQQNAGMYACMSTYMKNEDAEEAVAAGHAENVKWFTKHGK